VSGDDNDWLLGICDLVVAGFIGGKKA